MSTIDRQRVAAVETLVKLGFTFREGSWHPPRSTTVEFGEAEVLATLTCELRPPLNAVVILAEQLAHDPDANLSPKQVEFARTIHSAGKDLANLTADIVKISKMRSGMVSLDVEDIKLSSLVQEVVSPFHDEATARRINFNVLVDVDAMIRTDGRRLRELLNNLLSNAFRSTLYGGVTLRSFVFAGRGDLDIVTSQTIAFEVSNNGSGKRQMLSENFEPDDWTNTLHRYRGREFNLAICSELAKLLGGELRIDCMAGSDNTCIVTLPVRCRNPRPRAGQRAE